MKNHEERTGYLFSKRYTNYVFMLLFLLYMFDYIDRVIVTSMFTSIEADWGISHTQSGLLVSAVYWAIVILTFPVSILVDRWSRSKTIGIMAVMWGICNSAMCPYREFYAAFHGTFAYRGRRGWLCTRRYGYDCRNVSPGQEIENDGTLECINTAWYCNWCIVGRIYCNALGVASCFLVLWPFQV